MPHLVELMLLALAVCLRACSAMFVHGRQYWPDPEPRTRTPEECLDISLTNPTWGIFGPTLVAVNSSSGATQGDIRFSTLNSATGARANCSATDIDFGPEGSGEDIWHNCSMPDLSFQFTLETLEMRLRGNWKCDNTSSLIFDASGPWETPLIQGCLDEWNTARGQQTLCIMGNSQVSTGLSSPVRIHPQLPLRPYTPRERAQRCVDRSWDPEWQLNSLVYQHHSGQKDGKTTESYDLSVEVTNISNEQTMSCSVIGEPVRSQDAYRNASTPWVRCLGADASIDVALDTGYGIFSIRQSWECSDGVAGVERQEFNAIAYTNVSLACSTPFDSEADATPDYNCTLSSPATFTGYVDSVPAMPHTYYTRSCTIKSLTETTNLGLRDYRIESVSPQDGSNITSLFGTFTLHNPGSGDIYRIERMPVVDDGAWYECPDGEDGQPTLPWQLVGCKYMLDRESHTFGFEVQWYCDDRDPSNAILFNASAEVQLPAEVCETRDGVEVCGLPIDAAEVPVPVTALTWATLGRPMDRGPTLPWI